MVTRTEKRPRATRSVTSSMSLSVARGSLSFSYVLRSGEVEEPSSLVPAAMEEVEKVGVEREGDREKREGERTRKSRCWSKT